MQLLQLKSIRRKKKDSGYNDALAINTSQGKKKEKRREKESTQELCWDCRDFHIKRICPKKRERNKTTFSLAKPIIASTNTVNNNDITFSVEIKDEIAKKDIISETYIQIKVEELQNFFSKDGEIERESVEEYILLVNELED